MLLFIKKIIRRKLSVFKNLILSTLINVLIVTHLTASDTLVIEGTGDSQELLRALATAYEKKHSNSSIIIPNSIGSSGGIQKVINNLCTVARAARPLKVKEREKGLRSFVFAYSPIVFAINGDIKEISLTEKNILNIFDGIITTWDELPNVGLSGKIYIINREAGDSSKTILERYIPKFKDVQNEGITAFYTQEAIRLLNKYKNTIGYLPVVSTKNTNLTIVQLNGILPTLENIKNNKYKLVTPFSFVYKGELKGVAKKFKEFLKSDEAVAIMYAYGVIPNF